MTILKDEIQKEYIEQCVDEYLSSDSLRQAAKNLEISPMKLRKILITAGEFESEMSEEIQRLDKAGKSIEEIAEIQHMSKASVYSYLPYKNVLYNLPEKSPEAIRQKKYRDRKNDKGEVDGELLEWLNDHPGIVAELKKRSKGVRGMFVNIHATNVDEAKALCEKYNISFKVVKGEARAKSASKRYDFLQEVEGMLKNIGAPYLCDHKDVLINEDGEYLYICSPYQGMVDEELITRCGMYGYTIEASGCHPYVGVNAIVIRKK